MGQINLGEYSNRNQPEMHERQCKNFLPTEKRRL
jgi:hypothetical protein